MWQDALVGKTDVRAQYRLLRNAEEPKLFDTLAETEAYLKALLQADPECVNELRGTKGVAAGMQSFDDRSYLSFYVD